MKKGFTLLEIMVAVTLGTILLTGLYGVYVVNSKTYRRSISQQELAQNARIALERMSRDVRQTDRIVSILPSDDSDPFNPAPSNILFQDGHYTTGIRYIRYYLNETNLKRQVIHYYFSSNPNTWVAWNTLDPLGHLPLENIDEDVIKADKITNLKFYGSKIISIELSVANSDSDFNFKTKVWGRNIQ